jgi:hypothetical protein
MCYDDDASGPTVMTVVCPPEQEALLDCGDNDYFNTNPASGTYLATHWNTANSSFLQADDAPRPAQLSLTGAATITYGDHATLATRLSDEQTTTGIEGEQLTSSHGLKPWDSRFTLPLPQRGHQRRSAGLRPTGSDGSPRTRQAAPAGLAG